MKRKAAISLSGMVTGFLLATSKPAKNVCEIAIYNMGSMTSITKIPVCDPGAKMTPGLTGTWFAAPSGIVFSWFLVSAL